MSEKQARYRSKYNAIPQVIDDIRFDSTREAERYIELKCLVAAGEIANLAIHPRFNLLPPFVDPQTGKRERGIEYEADFSYRDLATGQAVIEDVKGLETPVFKLKSKLFRSMYVTSNRIFRLVK